MEGTPAEELADDVPCRWLYWRADSWRRCQRRPVRDVFVRAREGTAWTALCGKHEAVVTDPARGTTYRMYMPASGPKPVVVAARAWSRFLATHEPVEDAVETEPDATPERRFLTIHEPVEGAVETEPDATPERRLTGLSERARTLVILAAMMILCGVGGALLAVAGGDVLSDLLAQIGETLYEDPVP